ncbi:polysaccharide deacetylase family protein [Capnocytophaga granulosa]|jgi:predicted xylanase/chitin deacetylase|uniref:polysaccharide deacetylase family protein n=1 Tax=Capnocytophaga granulosa TaxID=45242 RepID=UPI0023F42598|nr:polysaccharide deacetylase family protein [Capnocytophaga granulosa]
MEKIEISTSWDDGAIQDLKLGELLSKFKIISTLYIPIKNRERAVITKEQIRELSKIPYIEIGSHTYNHVYLTTVPYDVSLEEVKKGREALEDILGYSIPKFCYPGGKFTSQITKGIKTIVEKARTCNIMSVKKDNNFNSDTTCHFMYRPLKSYIKQILLHAPIILRPKLLKWAFYNKINLYDLINIFVDYALEKEEDLNIHIWGHSWELEQYNLWDELEKTLQLLESLKKR